jgi:uncharacterized surface protein with fasciclin (FAS1) repeats
MTKQAISSISILLVFLFHFIATSAQPAAAPTQPADAPTQPANPPAQPANPPVQPAKAPTPAQPAQVPVQKGPIDVTKILEKAHGYSVFVRLLKSTGVAKQLYGQLNNSNIGFTIFAPTDSAFSNLKPGTINSLSDLQKTQLIQFHILNTVVTLSNFQTLSNPVPTEAGDVSAGAFPLNITTAGNQVNISTGLVNTTLGGTVYSDDQLTIYQVTKVLLPLDIFSPKAKKVAAAPTPTLSKPKTTKEDAPVSPSGAAKVDEAAAVSLSRHGMLESIGVAVVAFFVMKGIWWFIRTTFISLFALVGSHCWGVARISELGSTAVISTSHQAPSAFKIIAFFLFSFFLFLANKLVHEFFSTLDEMNWSLGEKRRWKIKQICQFSHIKIKVIHFLIPCRGIIYCHSILVFLFDYFLYWRLKKYMLVKCKSRALLILLRFY